MLLYQYVVIPICCYTISVVRCHCDISHSNTTNSLELLISLTYHTIPRCLKLLNIHMCNNRIRNNNKRQKIETIILAYLGNTYLSGFAKNKSLSPQLMFIYLSRIVNLFQLFWYNNALDVYTRAKHVSTVFTLPVLRTFE